MNARVFGLALVLTLSSACLISTHGARPIVVRTRQPMQQQPPPPPRAYPPPPSRGTIRVKEVHAGTVRARVIYAKEVHARDGRVGQVVRAEPRGNWGGDELRGGDISADTIEAKVIHADWLEAEIIYAKEVHVGR